MYDRLLHIVNMHVDYVFPYVFFELFICVFCVFFKEVTITDQHGNQIQNLTSSCMNSLGISGNCLDKSDLTTYWQVLPIIPCNILFIKNRSCNMGEGCREEIGILKKLISICTNMKRLEDNSTS